MVKCQVCNNSAKRAQRTVTERRHAMYPRRTYWKRDKQIEDPGGEGSQIARELVVCGDCVSKVTPAPVPTQQVEPVSQPLKAKLAV